MQCFIDFCIVISYNVSTIERKNMAKPINEKCLNCALTYKPGLRESNINYKPIPSCWDATRCHRVRNYYKHLEEKRVKQREYHRYLREKGDCCRLCKSLNVLEVHHIKPQCIGGTDDKSNLITLCYKCHKVISSYYKSVGFYKGTIFPH